MKRVNTILAAATLLGATAAPALADTRVETRIYEERIEPRAGAYYEEGYSDYYDQQPRTYYRESYRPVVVTDREYFRDGRCEVTRTHFSDGNVTEDRTCSRLMLPHEFIIDRMGRHFDRLRGYD